MKTIDERIELKEKIAFLKQKQAADFVILKQQYYATVASLKPLNLIKSAAQELITSPNLKSNVLHAVLDLGTAYWTKNLINANTLHPVKRVLGKIIQFVFKNNIGINRRKSSDID
jgi:hypothetical protein